MEDSIKQTLNELEEQSNREKSLQVNVPPEDRMSAITKETGELLNMILRLKNAKNILEIGMSAGYSTIWFAEAVREKNGQITSIEKNPNKIKRASENFRKADVSNMIDIKQGEATQVLNELCMEQKNKGYFDFVFIDADKENVFEYFDKTLPMVKVGGIIATDNMLYPEKYREHMERFSQYIQKNPNVKTITSPIGNGEEITMKLG